MSDFVIFLDFDGVITHDYSPREPFTFPNGQTLDVAGIDANSLELVEQIRKSVDADIVISSTWKDYHSIEDLRERLSVHVPKDKVICMTPTYQWPKKRGNEIQHVLDLIKPKRYVILDDMPYSEFLIDQAPFLVQTYEDLGIMESDVAAAIKILKGD